MTRTCVLHIGEIQPWRSLITLLGVDGISSVLGAFIWDSQGTKGRAEPSEFHSLACEEKAQYTTFRTLLFWFHSPYQKQGFFFFPPSFWSLSWLPANKLTTSLSGLVLYCLNTMIFLMEGEGAFTFPISLSLLLWLQKLLPLQTSRLSERERNFTCNKHS